MKIEKGRKFAALGHTSRKIRPGIRATIDFHALLATKKIREEPTKNRVGNIESLKGTKKDIKLES